MFGDHHVGKVLEEVTLIRKALEGVWAELRRANYLLSGEPSDD